MSETSTEPTVIPTVLPAENHAYRKAAWHILPLLMLCYVVAYLDRVNVGFAKLQMADDLQFSEAVYGFGAGIFFIAYFFLEIPSNLMLHRVGALAVDRAHHDHLGHHLGGDGFRHHANVILRDALLTGDCRGGLLPRVILYISYWFPTNRRGRMYALFATAVPLSGVIGAPLSGWIMDAFNGFHGFAGWQWMFILEGIPSVLIGILVIFKLTDRIGHAKWLTAEEKKSYRPILITTPNITSTAA